MKTKNRFIYEKLFGTVKLMSLISCLSTFCLRSRTAHVLHSASSSQPLSLDKNATYHSETLGIMT